MTIHDRAAEYLDNDLTHAEQIAFLEHLRGCESCAASLGDELQLRDREEQLSPPKRQPRPPAIIPRGKRALALGCTTSLLVAMAVLVIPGKAERKALAVAVKVSITPGEIPYRGDATSGAVARPGDRLHVTATTDSEDMLEVRIYRGAHELVARCPGEAAPDCRSSHGTIESLYMFGAPGDYQIQILRSFGPLPPATGDREADLRAVSERGGRVAELQTVTVN